MDRKRKAWMAAVAALLLLILIGGVWSIWGAGEQRVATIQPTTRKTLNIGLRRGEAVDPGALKVGVYLSKETGEQWGYSCQMTDSLNHHRQLDVVPILEPGSEDEPAVVKLLKVFFPGKKSLDVTNKESMKKLDVIVAPRIWHLPDDAREAIEGAVTNGTGLFIRNGLGCMVPGSGEEVSRLSGFEESHFGYDPHPAECEVLAEHPILGKLSGKIGQTLMITPNGTWGKLAAKSKPLIKVKDPDAFKDEGAADWVFYPLYIGELGKGRIVGCQWPAWEAMPKDLMNATDGEFNFRAVMWVGRRLDEPATKAAAP